ncbi:MAG: hypothetical protein J6Y20_10075 [Lachnospiraceae bacterium]|nr:hypothetical protein [Lachnospiraceae bacterium]MBP5462460.1 hypothetical protein [Lachnospiraceae bacterium]
MREYHKIETIFQRDTEGTKKLIPWAYRNETVAFLRNHEWVWTEKIDGTNIRVHWDGHKVDFGGRTDNASIPINLMNRLIEMFGSEETAQVFEQMFGEKEVILFGEGYGAKIQNGGNYTDGSSVDFALFDVMIGNNYQPRSTVEQIAIALGIRCVPIVGVGSLKAAIEFVKSRPKSTLGNYTHDMEGVVCRPAVELQDRCGNRLIVKIKWKDMDSIAEAL